jgi:RNA polymerase sigma-70 factor (ECF subfamily)
MELCVSDAPPKSGERALDTSWAELVCLVAGRDQEALACLYDLSSPYVYGLILRIVGDRPVAEEVTLDVYTQVWNQASDFQSGRGAVSTWLLTLARSRAIDWLRSRAGQARRRELALDEKAPWPDLGPSPEAVSAEARRRRIILGALASLEPKQREAIELAYFSGLSHREIAAHLDQPLGTVKTRIRLALSRLREQLQPYGEAI